MFDSVDLLAELARREKEAGIFPEAELDLFMKVLINSALSKTKLSIIISDIANLWNYSHKVSTFLGYFNGRNRKQSHD